MVGLDLKCEIAANNVAKSRMQAMCEQYGTELVEAVSSQMIGSSETTLRKRIAEIPGWRVERHRNNPVRRGDLENQIDA